MSYLLIDQTSFGAAFGHGPLGVSHSLLKHPLLSADRLGELADSLPADQVEHNVGDLPEVLNDPEPARSRLPAGEIARTIESNGLWMVLKFVETDPLYRELLDRALDEVEPLVASAEGGMLQREGFVFMSAPNAVTPSHTDPEHNILLQVRGSKEITVGRFPDSRSRQLEIEDHLSGGSRNIQTRPVDPQLFKLTPGSGVYVPPHAPHSVRNGPEASISLSITWRTPATLRTSRVSSVNARLRRVGFSPRPPGEREFGDAIKAAAWGALGRARRAFRS